jgi:RimJ/RimL family protein N-acetyltransferase
MTRNPTTSRVRLRDVTLADADIVDAMDRRQRTDGGYNDFGLGPETVPREQLEQRPLRDEKRGAFLVERTDDGATIGKVSWHQVRYGGNPESAAWNIGIDLIPEARGHGFGTEAQRQLAAHLFDTTGANRVEASTDIENVPEQRALEKAGFRREGVLRGAQFRSGAYHDMVVYARTRGDPD